jgi:hypothetical protein
VCRLEGACREGKPVSLQKREVALGLAPQEPYRVAAAELDTQGFNYNDTPRGPVLTKTSRLVT